MAQVHLVGGPLDGVTQFSGGPLDDPDIIGRDDPISDLVANVRLYGVVTHRHRYRDTGRRDVNGNRMFQYIGVENIKEGANGSN